MEKNVIIQYIRDEEKNPFGVVVAEGRNEIGFSLCNPVDHWNRNIGLDIAFGRAEKKSVSEQLQDISIHNSEKRQKVHNIIRTVQERAKKYFK